MSFEAMSTDKLCEHIIVNLPFFMLSIQAITGFHILFLRVAVDQHLFLLGQFGK